jgi:hypothetical protein
MPRFRVIGNLMLTFLTKIASGYWKTMDPQNGYTAVSKEALERMDLDWVYGGYGYCNDILIQLNAAELRVADVAIPAVYEDEESHINYRTYIPRLSKLLLSGFLWRLKTRYLVTDFHPLVLFYILGAVVCTVSAGMGVLATVQSVLGGGSLFVPLGLSLGLFVVGTICLLFAMVKDMEANEGKELQYFPGTVSTAEETTEAW